MNPKQKKVKMNTIENNKLIADFMGFKPCIVRSHKGKKYDYDLPNGFELIKEEETTIEGNWCEILIEQDHCFVEDLKFHTSWDWLMPVVEKITDLDIVNIFIFPFKEDEKYKCSVCLDDDRFGDFIAKSKGITRLEACYKTVVEFIKWYNKEGQNV